MERDQASKFINDLLKLMVARKGSDLFITADFPPAIKADGKVTRLMDQPLVPAHTMTLARAIMSDKQVAEFERTKECNFAISPAGIGRFRVNAFIQQGRVGMVLRTIPATIPSIDAMGLPQILKDVAMTQRGLCILWVPQARANPLLWQPWWIGAMSIPKVTSSRSKTQLNLCTRTRTASSRNVKWAWTRTAGRLP